jgi:hypothetical protein
MDEDILGAKVTQIGTKGSNTSDSSVLCGSKHEVWVYTVDYDDNGVVTPGVDNIIVAFSGTDSSGLGCIGDILTGGMKIFTDPKDWYTTVTTGFGGALAREGSPVGKGSFIGDAAVNTGVAGAIVATGDAVKDIPKNSKKIYCNYIGWGCKKAEEYRSDIGDTGGCFDDFRGTIYHNSNGASQKIRITITCDGEKMYQTEMAGSTVMEKIDGNLYFEPATKMFKITKPGTWKVKVTSLASSSDCSTPELDKTWTIEAPKPSDWDDFVNSFGTIPTEVTALTSDVQAALAGAGISTTVDPIKVLGGIIAIGGIVSYLIFRK